MEADRPEPLGRFELQGFGRFVTPDGIGALHEITTKPRIFTVDERPMEAELESLVSDPLEWPGGRVRSRLAIREAPAVLVKSLPRRVGGLANVEALGAWIEARLDERDPLRRNLDYVNPVRLAVLSPFEHRSDYRRQPRGSYIDTRPHRYASADS